MIRPSLFEQIKTLSCLWGVILVVALCIDYENHQPPPPSQAMVDAHWKALHDRDQTEYEQSTQALLDGIANFCAGVNQSTNPLPPK